MLANELKPRPFLVRDVIPGKQVSEIRGDGGTGKSTLALQLCAAAVTGRSWLGMHVARGPAIYLASEDDEDEIHRRLDAIATHLQVEREALDELHIWPLAIHDPALVVPSSEGLDPTPRWHQLQAFVRAIKPAVIVLDSRADVFGGEEISRKQVRAFVAMLRSLAVRADAAVIILAHPSASGLANGSGNSGSTHWTNAVRAALNFRKPKNDDSMSDPDVRILEVVKTNYARPSVPTMLRWSGGAFEVVDGGRAVNTSHEAAAADVRRLFLELLARYDAQGRRVSDKAGSNYAPKVFARDPDAKGTTSKGFEIAMQHLFKDGVLRMDESGPPSRPVRTMVIVPGRRS
jgi:RecA-family ATPase